MSKPMTVLGEDAEPPLSLFNAPFAVVSGDDPLPQTSVPVMLFEEAGDNEHLADPDSFTPTQKAQIACVFWTCHPGFIDRTLDHVHRWAEAGVPVVYMFRAHPERPSVELLADTSERFGIDPEDVWVRRKIDGRFVPSNAILDKVDEYFSVRDQEPETHNYRKVTVTRWAFIDHNDMMTCPMLAELMRAFAIAHKMTLKF